MLTVQKITNTLKTITVPGTGMDIINAGYVRNIQVEQSRVDFDVIIQPGQENLVQEAKEAVSRLEGITRAEARVLYASPKPQAKPAGPSGALEKVKHIIAVSSCKGGVGKSTVAAHLASEFARRGAKTGLLDADIHGPSVPTLFNLRPPHIKADADNRLIPVEHNGLKIFSFGFLLGDKPAIMRGPIATRYTQQMLLNTTWGELDYLFIDMPPGTNDIHLTITQSVRLTGAVIVTTPHTLSLIDVARGILMFEKVQVPILGVIENMSYFAAGQEAERHYVFGRAGAEKLEEQFGIKTLCEIPLLPSLGQERGSFSPNTFISHAADRIDGQVRAGADLKKNLPDITFNQTGIEFLWPEGKLWKVNCRQLRLHSRDALSVNELTGEKLIPDDQIPLDVHPEKIIPLGNYAVNIVWSDGHSAGIYPYTLIQALAQTSSNA